MINQEHGTVQAAQEYSQVGWPWIDEEQHRGSQMQVQHLTNQPERTQISASRRDKPNNQEERFSTPETMLRSGAIMQAYGRTDMISVTPAPDIHKVRWSIVKLKTSGREHVDFYMGMDDMRRLCAEILNGIAEKRIRADTANYPSAYQYTGGKDGCRRLNVGSGRKGICVQIQEKKGEKWDGKIIAVSWSALQDMAYVQRLGNELKQHYSKICG